ncbi:MAG: oligosaccharide flippase family protein [Chitinophagaceae bacterium]|nr:oligosaccharide flippase family protein [Chitinophagaceae bacterium]
METLEVNSSINKHVVWKAISLFFLFVLNVLFARYYAAATTGYVFYIFTVNAFIIQLLGFSLESGVGYYTARKSMREGRLINFSLMWTMIVTLLTLGLYYLYNYYNPGQLEFPVLYPISFVTGNMMIAFGNAIYFSKYNFVIPNVLSLIINITLIIFLIVSNEYSKVDMPLNFIPVYFYSFLVHGLLLFLSLFVVSKEEKFLMNITSKNVVKLFRYSSYAFLANILFLGLTRIDYFFIRHYCSAEDMGNYIQVSKIAQLFFILPSMISTVLFPFIAAGSKPDIKRQVNHFSTKLVMLYSGVCIALAASGYWLFPWMYGPSFEKMFVPFLLIIPGILAISGMYPYTAFFAGEDRINVNIKGSLFAFVFIVIADAALIPRYGINAAAAISSVGYFVYYWYVYLVFKKEMNVEKNTVARELVSGQA